MELDKESFIQSGQIKLVYENAVPSAIGIISIAVIVLYSFIGVVDHLYLGGWAAGMITIAILRLFLKKGFNASEQACADETPIWARKFTINTTIAGIGWGILCLIAFTINEPAYQTAIVLIIMGVMGASVPILSAHLPAFVSSSFPSAVILPLFIYTQLSDTAQLLSSAIVLFVTLVYFISIKTNSNLKRTFALQFENSILVNSLNDEIEERKEIQAQLEHNKKYLEHLVDERTEEIHTLSQAVEQSPVSVVITDSNAKVEYINSTFEKVTGYSLSEIEGKSLSLLQSGETPKEIHQELWDALNSGAAWQGELLNRRKNGEHFWVNAHIAPVFDRSGLVSHYLGVEEDITLRKEQEEQILHQAHFDSLTQLPNRFLALDRLEQLLIDSKRNRQQVAILFLDLDDFKKVNDTMGHNMGDMLLIEASKRLRGAVRSGDTVGRLGGDEFIVLLGGLYDPVDAQPIAENLLNCLRNPFKLNERELTLTTSIGIAVYPNDGEDSSELLRNADSAMYHSKELGRNTYSYFTEAMNTEVSRRLLLEEQMHGALERGEFRLCYQPQIDISKGNIVGVEALLRWNNPVLGEVSPDEFISVAEQTGLIIPIGQFVLNEALSTAVQWGGKDKPKFNIAINLSPIQFRDPQLVSVINDALLNSGIINGSLELEITEGVLMSGRSDVDDSLSALSGSGITISMDDFGTGYSSLSYLRRYPFNILKIDRSFVNDIDDNSAGLELIIATIAMAHGLGLKVVAEGVETKSQLKILAEQGCDFAQGYLFSRPVSANEITGMLENNSQGPIIH
ncbi:MAG: EAL domain-containing protein [Gammaproteobacteria bacterium]|nr:EAL domain-containing protein [Gammaproteobacteria bacterium]